MRKARVAMIVAALALMAVPATASPWIQPSRRMAVR